MALNTKFYADFSDFYAAVQKAQGHLKGFEGDADKTGKALDKMVDQFSGTKVQEQAAYMVKAIADIGGASKLTDAELKKVGATVSEAIDKMERMGTTVPQEFKDIQQAAAGATQATFDWKSALISTAGALGVAFSVNALKDFAIGVLDTASKIGDMSEKLGISAEAAQRFEYAADQSGATIETVDKAIKAMNVNLADGSKGTIAALTEAGLKFTDIRRMAPEKAFEAIGDAVAKIEDPMERAKVATELFGKAGQELIPTFLAGIKKVGDETAVMSDDTVRRLKAAQDAWSRFKNAVVVSSGEWIAAVEKDAQRWINAVAALGKPPAAMWNWIQSFRDQSGAMVQSASDIGAMAATITPPVANFADRGLKPVALTADQATAAIGYLDASLPKLSESSKKAAAEQAKLATAIDDSLERVRLTQFNMGKAAVAASQNVQGFGVRMSETVAINRDFSKELTASTIHTDRFGHVLQQSVEPSLKGVGRGMIDATEQTETWDDSLDDLAKSFAQLGQTAGGTMGTVAQSIGRVVTSMKLAEDAGKGMKAGFEKGGVAGYSQLAEGAIGAIGAIDAATNSGNKAIAVMGGMAAGAKLGTQIMPGWGTAIGAAAGAITGFVKANSAEGKNVSPLRDVFFSMAGGLEVLNPQVEKLTGNLTLVQAVFDAKTVEDYNAAIANLNGLFKAEQDALATLTATADKYGLTIEELGPAMQKQNLDKQAQQLYKDWQVLNAAGIQTSVITNRMSESINKYVSDAVSMGQEVPDAMRPMIEKMVEMGTLTDASGNKIDSLENSGINFSLTMSEGFKALITSVEKLADVLSRSLGTAIDTTTKKIKGIPDTIDVGVNYTENAPKGPDGKKLPGYATGTDGKFVDFGAGTLAMLHGKEAIVPEGAVRSASVGGNSASVTINVNAQGAFFDTPGDLQRLADKVNDALTAKYGLTNRLRAA